MNQMLKSFSGKLPSDEFGSPVSRAVSNASANAIEESSSRIQIDVLDLNYHVAQKDKIKVVLKEVSVSIKSGEMCAIMGPSGAGKSTLLDLIANRKKVGFWSGEVMINRKPRPDWFNKIAAYVLQDDVFINALSVEETLAYASWTRMPGNSTKVERDGRVDSMLDIMGMQSVRKNKVATISKGQKKRLAIAVEIIALPRIIFLDEPTSGIDSSISLEVMASMRKIVDRSRVCIATIHQPSTEMFSLFDRLILMNAGRVIYSGPADKAIIYFDSIGFPFVPGQNPGEYVIKICGDKHRSPDDFQRKFMVSKYFVPPESMESATQGIADLFLVHQPVPSSFWQQLHMLLIRGTYASVRDVASVKAEFVKYVFFGFLIGVTYYDDAKISPPYFEGYGQPTPDLSNFTSLYFFVFMFLWYGNTQSIPTLCQMDHLYRREVASAAYSPLAYWSSAMLCHLPKQVLLFTLFIGIFYPLAGYPSNAAYFFYMYLILFITCIMSYYASLAFAALKGDPQIAYAIVPPLFMCFGIFSGYPLVFTNLPEGWSWAPYCSFLRWAFEALLVHEFGNDNDDDGNGNNSVLAHYGFTAFSEYNAIWILLLYVFAFASLCYFGLARSPSTLVKLFNVDYANYSNVNPVSESGQLEIETGGGMRKSEDLIAKHMNSRMSFGLRGAGSPMEYTIEDPPRFTNLDLDDFRSSNIGLDNTNGLKIDLVNICYHTLSTVDKNNVQLLQNITGSVYPGQMCAIMGTSGSGKTTLLDIIAGRKDVGTVTGMLLFNGADRNIDVVRSSSYVTQADVHLPMLTAKETLYFAAQLRMDVSESALLKELRVKKVLEILKLDEQANTLVGNHVIRGLSGGQKRRLSIGVEIINFPGLIFLDEPTTGLDSATSDEVLAAIRNLANQNRTIVSTIQQPSSKAFYSFDTVVLLSKGGYLAYFGPTKDAVNFFVSSPFGFRYNPSINPAEYVVAIAGGFVLSKEQVKIDSETLAKYFKTAQAEMRPEQPSFASEQVSSLTVSCLTGASMYSGAPNKVVFFAGEVIFTKNGWHHTQVLLKRYYLKTIRTPRAIVISFIRCGFLAFLFGTVFSDTPNGTTYAAYQNRYAFCFLSLFFSVIVQIQSIPIYFEDLVQFNKESSANLYYPECYWLATRVVYFVFFFLHTLLFMLIAYFASGLYLGGQNVMVYFISLYFSGVCGYFFCQIVALLSPSPQAAMSIYPMAVFFNCLYCGFFQQIPNMQPFLKGWLPYTSFMRWGYQALVVNEFSKNDNIPNAQFYLDQIGFDGVTPMGCVGIIVLFIIFYNAALITIIALKHGKFL